MDKADDDAAAATAGDHQAFLAACGAGDLEKVKAFLAAGFPAYYQEEEGGTSVLMHAAEGAHLEVVQALLAAGAPWMALDRQGKCAGEHAMASEVEDAKRKQAVIDTLVNHAVMAEMLLGTMQDQAAAAVREEQQQESAQYLGGNVRYEKDRLVDEEEEGVMMEWEAPLMEAHASLLCGEAKDRDVMNVGFGMGIIDEAIQRHGCRSHTILEAHPTVLKKMEADGWTQKPGVSVEAGRWQETLPRLVAAGKKYDALFFDTYAEHYRDMQAFHEWLPKLLRPGGMYSFFNGLCPDNLFFHAVTCQLVKLELEALNFAVDFATVEVEGGAAEEGTWEGLRRRYWHGREEYYLPVAIIQGEGEDAGEGEAMKLAAENDETPTDNSANDNETADDTLVGEAQVGEDGETIEVLLHAALDPEAGGLTWRPYPDMRGRLDSVCLLQLRCWFPPMLHDAHRHALFRRAIQGAVQEVQQQQQQLGQEGERKEVRVLDIGTGTSLLSLEAVRAGATHVVACEGFPALAAVAQEVVRAAGMEVQIQVLSKRSTALEKEETGTRDLVISELLDSTLLGEGYLSTLRDLYSRGLISPTTRVLPARARVWAQLVECPELPSHCYVPAANVACAGGGRPLPLYLAPPTSAAASSTATTASEAKSERKRERSATDDEAAAGTATSVGTEEADFVGGPITSIALSAPIPLLDIDFAAVAAATTPAADVENGPVRLGLSTTVPILRTGTLHGVLMWWDLTPLDDTETYTSAPRNPSTDPLWQDHWKPCIWPLATPKSVDAAQTISVQGAHDDQTVWMEVGGGDVDQAARRLREGPSPCVCGLHTSLPVGRVMELNDADRQDIYRRAMQQVVGESKGDVHTILDICDGGVVVSSLLGAHQHQGGGDSAATPSLKLVSLEQHPWYAAVLERSSTGNSSSSSSVQDDDADDARIAVWRGAGAGEGWDSATWGEEVQVLCGDGYYVKVGLNRPVWSWLNFWILRTALAPVLTRDVVVLPFQARLMAAVVECPSLYRVHGGGKPVADDEVLGGWNHDAYRRAVEEGAARAVCDEDKDLPVSLVDHPHRFLTPPALVMRLDLHRAIDWTASRADDGAYRRSTIQVPFEEAGHAHALALWVDVDLTYGAATGGDPSLGVSGCGPRHARQTLRWLSGERVGGGDEGGKGWGVEVKAAMDLVETPGIWTECRIVAKGGGGQGSEENGEDGRD